MADVSFDIGGGNNDYASLSAAVAAQFAIRPNLVSNDERLIFNMYAFNDSTAVTLSGWTTDSTRYIMVTSPSSERHAGVFSTSKAYMSNTATTCLTVNAAYTVVEYMQFTVSTANISGVAVSGSDVRIRNCIVRATDSNPQTLLSLTNACNVRNTLVYDSGRHGVFINADNITLQNCTITGSGRHGIWNLGGSSNVVLTNVLSANNGASYSDFNNDGGGMTNNVSYCASSDATADDFGTGSGNRVSQTFTFVNAGSDDYHLASTDAGALGYGTDLSGTFTIDIDGETRSSWDIGADEYVAASVTYTYNPSGGITFSATAPHLVIKIPVISGGVAFAGVAPLVVVKIPPISGGLAFDGIADVVVIKIPPPSGGVVFAGAAATSFTSGLAPSVTSRRQIGTRWFRNQST